jgi:alpha-tubulin suppressor-like RCC1 family protein
MGENYFGQLGISDAKYREVLECVYSAGNVLDFSCGNLHSVLVTKKGEVYGTGSLQSGQVQTSEPRPKLDILQKFTLMLANRRITKV